MEKLSAEQAYQIGVKLALHELGVDDKTAQSPAVPIAQAAPAVAATVGQAAPTPAPAAAPAAARPIPQGAQQMPGAQPGSYENPGWRQQAMPATPAMKPVLRG